MFIEQLILFLNLLFGTIFVYRMLKIMATSSYYRKEKLTKIGIVVFCFYFILNIVFSNSYFIYLVQILLCLFLKIALHKYMLYHLQKLYWKEFPRFLSHLQLSLKMGESFRSSVQRCLPLLSLELQHIIRRIMEVVVFSQHNNEDKVPHFINELIRLFKKIDRSPHLATALLEHEYKSLLMKRNFRHKSGQLLLQTRVQSIIIFLFYVLTAIYTDQNYSLNNFPKIFFLSAVLMLLGFVVLKYITRSFKWSE